MTYLLDTNACVAYLRTLNSPIRRRLATLSAADISLCAVVKAELVYGAQRSADPTRSLTELAAFFAPYVSFPFDDAAAMIAGRIRADLAARGTPISPGDLHIAAIALAHDLTLVTHNTREFVRVAGLRLEDWEAIP